MVLPEPTSPCTSRFMGAPEAVSAATSSMARRWAAVREKGSSARNSSTGGVEKGTPSAQVVTVVVRGLNRPAHELLEDLAWQVQPQAVLRVDPVNRVLTLARTLEARS